MRADLRRLLWQLRAGVIRRATLEVAVEEACTSLIAARHDREVPLRQAASCILPLLSRFEDSIFDARSGASEGDFNKAIRAVEDAETELVAGRRLSVVLEAWERLRADWTRWVERLGLQLASELVTLREGERLLRVARRFLDAGEDRKARFVVQRGQALLDRLGARNRSRHRRQELRERLETLLADSPPGFDGLAGLIDRLLGDGRLELADRLLDDWEMGPEGSGSLGGEARTSLARILTTSREARSLALELEPAASPDEAANRNQSEAGTKDQKGA
jgi:hypothetical protein